LMGFIAWKFWVFDAEIPILILGFYEFFLVLQFIFGNDVPDHGQHFPFLVGCKDARVDTEFHGLLDKASMFLVAKQDGVTAGASNINS